MLCQFGTAIISVDSRARTRALNRTAGCVIGTRSALDEGPFGRIGRNLVLRRRIKRFRWRLLLRRWGLIRLWHLHVDDLDLWLRDVGADWLVPFLDRLIARLVEDVHAHAEQIRGRRELRRGTDVAAAVGQRRGELLPLAGIALRVAFGVL